MERPLQQGPVGMMIVAVSVMTWEYGRCDDVGVAVYVCGIGAVVDNGCDDVDVDVDGGRWCG
jgi:hypothetical protein